MCLFYVCNFIQGSFVDFGDFGVGMFIMSNNCGFGDIILYGAVVWDCSKSDIDGDGCVDVCGCNGSGVTCCLLSGNVFDIGVDGFVLFNDNGWCYINCFSMICMVDFNGDGFIDLCVCNNNVMCCWLL